MEQRTYSRTDQKNYPAREKLIVQGRCLHDRTISAMLLKALNICKSAAAFVDIDCSVENPGHVKLISPELP